MLHSNPRAENPTCNTTPSAVSCNYVRWRENGRQRIARRTPRGCRVTLSSDALARASPRRGAKPGDRRARRPARPAGEPAPAVAQEQHVDGPGDGVFSYETKQTHAVRSSSVRAMVRPARAVATPRCLAARKAKQKLEESIRRGEVKVARESSKRFGRSCPPSASPTSPRAATRTWRPTGGCDRRRSSTASTLERRRRPRPRVANQDGCAHREHRLRVGELRPRRSTTRGAG